MAAGARAAHCFPERPSQLTTHNIKFAWHFFCDTRHDALHPNKTTRLTMIMTTTCTVTTTTAIVQDIVSNNKTDDPLKDVCHVNPYDNHELHVWFWEPQVARGVLTQDGVTQIAHHKYKPGTYTALDSFLNPAWESFTELLPMWLAPNAVTALGSAACMLSYVLVWRYNFTFQDSVPSSLLVWNGLCLMLYYTLDCMDGKQARRTSSSSPLGQLFDHGVDCVSNLSHIGLMQCILNLPTRGFWWLQICTQVSVYIVETKNYTYMIHLSNIHVLCRFLFMSRLVSFKLNGKNIIREVSPMPQETWERPKFCIAWQLGLC